MASMNEAVWKAGLASMDARALETHAVVSWIWNADGTAGIQRLAVGDEHSCREYAKTAKPVTDDPKEIIVVVPNAALLNLDSSIRLTGLN